MAEIITHPLYQEDLARLLSAVPARQFANKTFLVTGATGLIGRHLIDALMLMPAVSVVAAVRNVDKAKNLFVHYLSSPYFRLLEHDVCQPFPDGTLGDYILPLASNTHPRAYAEWPVETMQTNLLGASYALQLARQTGATMLYPSTVEVYGQAKGNDVFTEDYTGQLNLATSRAGYTESKRAAEALCQCYAAEYGVKVKIVRLSRIFGPTMQMTDSKASSQFIKKAIAGEDIVLKSEGTQYFSYTYVTDAVAAMLYVLVHGEYNTAYNISADACNVHLCDFASLCAEQNGRQVVFDLPDATERRGFSIATQAIMDNSRLQGIGYQPMYEMRDAVRRTIEILRS